MAVSLPQWDFVHEGLARLPFSVRQTLLGLAYASLPRRLPGVLPAAVVVARDYVLSAPGRLPHARDALILPDGLCGVARNPDVGQLLEGYARGMFVHSHLGPLKWWAPRHRMVLFFDEARIEKTTRRLLNNGRFRVTFDTAFADVIRACAAPRAGQPPLTWITPRIQTLFMAAHKAGHAHSVEVWQDDRLVGGAYGLAVGRLFFTESQFHLVRDASKVGFAVLNRHLQARGFVLNDGKNPTRFLADCGMRPITRREFTTLAGRFGREAMPSAWTIDTALTRGDWKPADASGMKFRDVLPSASLCRYSADELMSSRRSNTW
jgi:leucyl/phenylalanyl-tRNA--protein transferase